MADEAAMDIGGRPDPRRGSLLGARVDDPATLVQVERWMVVEELHLRLPVAVDGAHVLPISVESVAVDTRAGRQHRRHDVAAEVVAALAEPSEEGLGREDVDAQAGQVAARLPGLLLPFG